MPLTDAWLKANHGKDHGKAFEKGDRDGMSVRVSAKGKIVFQLRYRWQGKPARLDLGTYPLTSLRDAREQSQRRKAQLEEGQDPRVAKRTERAAVAGALTNQQLFDLWYEKDCEPSKLGAGEIKRSFVIHVMPTLGNLPVDSTPAHTWLDLVEELAKERPSISERIVTNAKQMHQWGKRRQLTSALPLENISARKHLRIQRNEGGRVLSEEEIRLIWHTLEQSRLAGRSKVYIKLCLLFGCRNGELRTAPVSEIAFRSDDQEYGRWEIPASRHKTGKKTGRPIVRPIIPEFEPLIRDAMLMSRRKDRLFSNEGNTGELGSRAVLSFAPRLTDSVKKRYGVEMPPWSLHDLRRTARTHFSQLAQPHIAEIMLGHTLPGVWRVYDKHDYLDEQAEAYRAWHQRLMDIVATPPNVRRR